MTVKEVKEIYKGQYEEIEVYSTSNVGKHYPDHFHTDNCKFTEEFTDESKVGLYELMDEEDYNNSIMANASDYADFESWYGNKEAKVLCIMLAYIRKDDTTTL